MLVAVTALLALVLAACQGGGGAKSAGSSSASSSPSSSAGATTTSPPPSSGTGTRTQPSAEGSGSSGQEPTEPGGFSADTSPDGGPAQAGATGDPAGQMHVAGIRIGQHAGYERVVIDLNSAGVPKWTVRYTEASGPGGGPVTIAGDAFLRVVLTTEAQSGVQGSSSVTLSPGPIAQVKTTGFFEGDEEVLIGIRKGEVPFRAFAMTDPGRIVVDVRAP